MTDHEERDGDRWWCTQRDAAALLGITEDMLRSVIRRGQLTPVRVGGRRLLRRSDVEALRQQLLGNGATT